MSGWRSFEGSPHPQGVTWIKGERAFNFALYSRHATSVTLLLYGASDLEHPLYTHRLDYLQEKTGRIWHCRVKVREARGARYYAYAVDGPAPEGRFEWHAFDREKVLVDPYARTVFFPPAFDRHAATQPGSNAGRAPLGVLGADVASAGRGTEPRPRHESEAIIYELHVRGFTRHPSSGVRAESRGTFAGLVEKIPYLKELGVTVVELMPVFQYDPRDGNYWGYDPINFFAPHHEYASTCGECGQQAEFHAMVRAMHQAGIEVILDVVYNHTGEGGADGPVYSYKGLDNSTYYLMSEAGTYQNYSGTGNTLHTANRYVRKLIVDSLRYWADTMGVDGFRFDLASVFSRQRDGTLDPTDPGVFADIVADPQLSDLRLIAEPWDAGGAYQLGVSLPGVTWQQWNGRFRDDVRRFVRGDPGLVPALMTRLYGSADLFPDDQPHAYHAFQSINYITCHDGFTLHDLVSYNEKRNWANGHQNRDGPADNISWNCGWEGDTGVQVEVLRLRQRQAKNFCALLLLAAGTPMLRSGDEFLHTQGGNNNAYNQDNETSWLDWGRLSVHRDIFRFFKRMIAFRKAHPSLGRSRFWRGDIRWYGVGADPDVSFDSHSLAYCLHGASQGDADLYVMINGYWQALTFQFQEGTVGAWRRVFDTALESPDDFADPGSEVPVETGTYELGARTVAVFVRTGD